MCVCVNVLNFAVSHTLPEQNALNYGAKYRHAWVAGENVFGAHQQQRNNLRFLTWRMRVATRSARTRFIIITMAKMVQQQQQRRLNISPAPRCMLFIFRG